jgi:hypothetical protein
MSKEMTIKKCMLGLIPTQFPHRIPGASQNGQYISERDATKLRKLISGDYDGLYINSVNIEDFFVYDDDSTHDRDGQPVNEEGQDLISLSDYMA